MNTTTMKWLIRREFWENKGSLFWAPIVAGALMVLFISATALWGIASGKVVEAGMQIDGHPVDMAALYATMPSGKKQAISGALASTYMAAAAPLFLMLSVVSFFYCLGALYDERRDRSILFWKSLPLSDQATVLSKLATAVCVAPVITVAVATLTSLTLLLIGTLLMAFKGINLFGVLLGNPNVYLAPLQVLALLPVYALWALPTVGYLFMVSAWARSKVFLWAVGVPIMTVAVLAWTNFLSRSNASLHWFVENVLFRILGGLFPGGWLGLDSVDTRLIVQVGYRTIDMSGLLAQSYKTLLTPEMWIGAAAGAAMIFAAIRLRRWKDDG
jgi:ABC-2 type transport system permease protein